MKAWLVRVVRWPRWPIWALGVGLLWLGLAGAGLALGRAAGVSGPPCMFKRLTGVPCPTCGATRGCLALLRGHVGAAWWCNPLLFTLAGLAGLWLVVRLVFGRQVRLELTKAERRVALVVLGVAFLANWAYVIRYVG